MDAYEGFKVFLILLCVFIAIGVALYCFGIWLFSRATHIEPIVCDSQLHKHATKWPKIDISVAYQGAKVGQVLGARK